MNDDFDETSGPELTADEEALLKELPALTDVGRARRTFLGQTIAGSLGVFALMLIEKEQALAAFNAPHDAVFAPATLPENPVRVVPLRASRRPSRAAPACSSRTGSRRT